jgi:hypothetical protein
MSFVLAFVVIGSVYFPIALMYRRDVYTHINDESGTLDTPLLCEGSLWILFLKYWKLIS